MIFICMTNKTIPIDIQIRIDTVNWIFQQIDKISDSSNDKSLTQRQIQALLKQLDALEDKFEWEKNQLNKMGFEL